MRPVSVTTSDASGGTKTSSVIPLDIYARPQISLQADVSGTATWTVQQTLDDVFDTSVTPTWFDHPDSNMVSQTVDRQGNYGYVPRACRLVQSAGNGSVKLTVIQPGIIG